MKRAALNQLVYLALAAPVFILLFLVSRPLEASTRFPSPTGLRRSSSPSCPVTGGVGIAVAGPVMRPGRGRYSITVQRKGAAEGNTFQVKGGGSQTKG